MEIVVISVENKAISNIVDKATSSQVQESVKTFGDGRRPICDKKNIRSI